MKPIWTSFAISFLGIWLLVSPQTFAVERTALIYSDWIAGALLFFLGLFSRKRNSLLLSWILGIVGIWLNFAPLGFRAVNPASYLNDTLVGTLVIACSLLIPHRFHEEVEATIPPGWSYNPSSFAQRLPIAFLIFLCWMTSRYLAAFELGYFPVVWDPFFGDGTEKVLTSNISKDFPLPDAGLGAFAYTLEFLSTCQGGNARWRTDPWLVLIFGLLVIPVGFTSLCLVILQPIIVHSWCSLCLFTALCMLLAIPLALDEVIAALQALKKDRSKPFLKRLFQGTSPQGAKVDLASVSLDQPLSKILKASLQGISFPWPLIVSSLLGLSLMGAPAFFHIVDELKDFDPILGALIVVFSVIGCSNLARKMRWGLPLFGGILLVVTFLKKGSLSFPVIGFHVLVEAILIFLTRKQTLSS